MSALKNDTGLPDATLKEIEAIAVDLATLGGAKIVSTLGKTLSVRYKGESAAEPLLKDPVSEVDHEVELLLRAQLADRFPEHDVIGEEMDERPGRNHEFVWAVDPIDGTTNFINGFPLFASSVGVLHRGRPVVGAVWCSSSHTLRPGVYHARLGGPLRFEQEALAERKNPSVRKRLIGVPAGIAESEARWDGRKTGSAAVECAFVAARLLEVARFAPLNIWDVAGGICLIRAAGREVWIKADRGWAPMERFEPMAGKRGGAPDLRNWRAAFIAGDADAVAHVAGAMG
jgi:myo-inositol-1(or 4)-monophosphatase